MDLGGTRKKLCCVPSERQCSVVKKLWVAAPLSLQLDFRMVTHASGDSGQKLLLLFSLLPVKKWYLLSQHCHVVVARSILTLSVSSTQTILAVLGLVYKYLKYISDSLLLLHLISLFPSLFDILIHDGNGKLLWYLELLTDNCIFAENRRQEYDTDFGNTWRRLYRTEHTTRNKHASWRGFHFYL